MSKYRKIFMRLSFGEAKSYKTKLNFYSEKLWLFLQFSREIGDFSYVSASFQSIWSLIYIVSTLNTTWPSWNWTKSHSASRFWGKNERKWRKRFHWKIFVFDFTWYHLWYHLGLFLCSKTNVFLTFHKYVRNNWNVCQIIEFFETFVKKVKNLRKKLHFLTVLLSWY